MAISISSEQGTQSAQLLSFVDKTKEKIFRTFREAFEAMYFLPTQPHFIEVLQEVGVAMTLLFFSALGVFPLWLNILFVVLSVSYFAGGIYQVESLHSQNAQLTIDRNSMIQSQVRVVEERDCLRAETQSLREESQKLRIEKEEIRSLWEATCARLEDVRQKVASLEERLRLIGGDQQHSTRMCKLTEMFQDVREQELQSLREQVKFYSNFSSKSKSSLLPTGGRV